MGYRKTADRRTDWRQDAVCTQFPTTWADRLWLYEDAAAEDKPDRSLRITARMVCNECPVRIQCLASATIDGEKYGIRGGLRYRERLVAAEMAEKDGLVIYSRTGADRRARYEQYAAWLAQHQEVFDTVPKMEQKAATARRRRKTACERTRTSASRPSRRETTAPSERRMSPTTVATMVTASDEMVQQPLF